MLLGVVTTILRIQILTVDVGHLDSCALLHRLSSDGHAGLTFDVVLGAAVDCITHVLVLRSRLHRSVRLLVAVLIDRVFLRHLF